MLPEPCSTLVILSSLLYSLPILVLAPLVLVSILVDAQAKRGEWEKIVNDSDHNLSIPTLQNFDSTTPDGSLIWHNFWNVANTDIHPDLIEYPYILQVIGNDYGYGQFLWGNPLFFCIDIPKMVYEGYSMGQMGGSIIPEFPQDRKKIDKWNMEGVGWSTSQPRSKSRYMNAYSLFWIMEPTSFRWNRRFVFRVNAAEMLGLTTPKLGFSSRDLHNIGVGNATSKTFLNWDYDPYTKIEDGFDDRWDIANKIERKRVEDAGLYWHVDVTGIRDPKTGRVLKGWFHLKITLRSTKDGKIPVSSSQYVIDRLAVSARGLTFNYEFLNTYREEGFHSRFNSDIDEYFDHHFYNNRPHRVWEGGAGEFIRDFPKCRGVTDHEFAERQFVPCGSTGKSQWYYGNNFIYVKTDYDDYEDQSGNYGGGIVKVGGHEEIHLNFKLDQSFCNMYLALDFVVTGVGIKADRFMETIRMGSFQWMIAGRNHSFAVERSSSTRIVFVTDDHVNPPDLTTCTNPNFPVRKWNPPFIKSGNLTPLTFYENADPIPIGVEDLDCFVPLAGSNGQVQETFGGAIQDIYLAEDFSVAETRGLTLSYWDLYTRGVCVPVCVGGQCKTVLDPSPLIRDQVKEWDWRTTDPSDISLQNRSNVTIPVVSEFTRIPYMDSTFRGVWMTYIDYFNGAIKDYKSIGNYNVRKTAKFGIERGWPGVRLLTTDSDMGWGEPLEVGSYFLDLYFLGIPFFGRGTADRSHQVFANRLESVLNFYSHQYAPYSGEPGMSPPACDLLVSRYYLRILDLDDEEEYRKPLGPPNDPADTCFINTSRLTTDPALQYIRKAYVRPRSQPKLNVNGTSRPSTWYEHYVQNAPKLYEEVCRERNLLPTGSCPTMPPLPFTTPSTEKKSAALRPRPVGLPRNDENMRGMRIDITQTLFVWDKRVMHGTWMTIMTIFILPINTFLTRYFKETFMDQYLWYHRIWYIIHVFAAVITLPLYLVGLRPLWSSADVLGWSYATIARSHRLMGYVSLVLSFFLVGLGGFRLKSPRLRLWTIFLHFTTGTIIYILLLSCMLSAIFIPGSPASYIDFGIFVLEASTLAKYEYCFWFIVFWIVFDIIMQISMTGAGFYIDKDMKLHPSRYYVPCPIPVVSEGFQYDSPGSRRRTSMLLLYIIVSVSSTLLICGSFVVTTPFTSPQRGLGWMSCSHSTNGSLREGFPKRCPHIDDQRLLRFGL